MLSISGQGPSRKGVAEGGVIIAEVDAFIEAMDSTGKTVMVDTKVMLADGLVILDLLDIELLEAEIETGFGVETPLVVKADRLKV